MEIARCLRAVSESFREITPRSRPAIVLLLAFTMAHGATAKAVRPGVNTEEALRRLKLSMPVELQTVIDKNQLGLDFEDEKLRKLTLKQAHEYMAYRKGQIREAMWQAGCRKDQTKNVENPFCDYESDRHEHIHLSHAPSTTKALKRSIATQMKAGNFSTIEGASLPEMIGGVAALGNMQAVREMAHEVAIQKSCTNPAIPYALGYKLEEEFPDAETVKLSKVLYRKSVDCGNDLAAATASFRLALIDVWQNDCKDVSALMLKTEKTPTASTYHARAKYWRYYCGDKEKNQLAMTDARASLLRDHPLSFQNLAVNGEDTAGLGTVLQTSDPQLAFRSLIRPDLNGLLRATEVMMKLGNEPIAIDILDRHVSAINEMEPEVRLYSAVLLNRLGSALPKFKILTNLFDERPRMISLATMKLYFPLWYFDIVKIKQNEIDPLLILSLIRQESAFNKQARSTVGARGLMQVMPATARTVSRAGARNLFDPKTNINVGTTYLMRKLQQYNGDVELTLAAYNAGFGRVDDWLRRYPTENKMLFLDFIPFRETRDYVSMILRNYYWYVKLYDPSSNLEIAKVIESQATPESVAAAAKELAAKVSESASDSNREGKATSQNSDDSEIAFAPFVTEPIGPFAAEDDGDASNASNANDTSEFPGREFAAKYSGNEKHSLENVAREIERSPAGSFAIATPVASPGATPVASVGATPVAAVGTTSVGSEAHSPSQIAHANLKSSAKHGLGSRLGFATKAFRTIPKAAAIMSANAGLAAGVLTAP